MDGVWWFLQDLDVAASQEGKGRKGLEKSLLFSLSGGWGGMDGWMDGMGELACCVYFCYFPLLLWLSCFFFLSFYLSPTHSVLLLLLFPLTLFRFLVFKLPTYLCLPHLLCLLLPTCCSFA